VLSTVNGVGKFGRRRVIAAGVVTDSMTLHLNANNAASYPGSGSTWFDLAGTADNITLVNSPAFTSGTPSYFTFNGSTQYGSGSAANILPSAAYTKSVWFYLNAYYDNNLISSDSGGHFMYFGPSPHTTLWAGHSNVTPFSGPGAFGSTYTLSLNTWYYAAVTYSIANGIKLYINGVLNNSTAMSAHTGNGSVNIAAFATGNNLNGRIAQVFCYSKELSATEVLQNFNSTKAIYGL
jgi:hypothetical protein